MSSSSRRVIMIDIVETAYLMHIMTCWYGWQYILIGYFKPWFLYTSRLWFQSLSFGYFQYKFWSQNISSMAMKFGQLWIHCIGSIIWWFLGDEDSFNFLIIRLNIQASAFSKWVWKATFTSWQIRKDRHWWNNIKMYSLENAVSTWTKLYWNAGIACAQIN